MKVMNFKEVKLSKNIWFNYDEMFSKNRAINFIIGPRGRGKTYGLLKWHIKRFIKMYYKRLNNPKLGLEPVIEELILMRRYQTELEKCAPTLYSKVANEFPKYEFKYSAFKWYIRPKKEKEEDEESEWMVICHLIALTTAYQLKGTAFPFVKYLGYDEFLFEKGQVNKELKEEVNKFFNVLETIFRFRNDFRVILLGNATTFETTYKYELKLQLPFNSNYWYCKDKPILVCLATNQGFLEAKQESLVGILAKGTSYEQGMIFNEFYGDSTTFIRKKVGNYRRLATFNYKEDFYAIYYRNSKKKYEIIIDTYKYDGKMTAFTIRSDDMNPGLSNMIFNRNNSIYMLLKKYFNKNCLYYQNMRVKTGLHNLFLRIF